MPDAPAPVPDPAVTLDRPQVIAVAIGEYGAVVEFSTFWGSASRFEVSLWGDDRQLAIAYAEDSPALLPWGAGTPGVRYDVQTAQKAAGGGNGDGAGIIPERERVPIILVPATLGHASADGSALLLEVRPPDAGGVKTEAYAVELLRGGMPVLQARRPAPVDGMLRVDLGRALEPPGTYALRVRPVSGRSTGPPADAALVLATPVVTEATVVGVPDALKVAAAVGGEGPWTQLEAVLVVDGARRTPAPVVNGMVMLDVPSGAVGCALEVRALTDTATGPWSAGIRVPVAIPEITARYDGAALAATWENGGEGEHKVAIVRDEDSVVAEATVRGRTGVLPLMAATASAYAIHVREVDGVVTGPVGELDLVTDGCPVVAASGADDGEVTLSWTAPAHPATVTAYQPAVLWDGRETPLAELPPTATETTLTLPDWVPSGAALAVRAIAGAATGPLGSPAPVLLAAPDALSAEYDGAEVVATWEPVADERIAAYEAVLAVAGRDPERRRVALPRVRFAFTPDPPPAAVTATVSVAALAGVAIGPAAPARAVIARAPEITAARVAGTTLDLEWSAVEGAGAYEVRLRRDGSLVHEVTVGGPAASVALPPGPLTVEVRAVAERSSGPASTRVDLLTAAPVLTSTGIHRGDGSLYVDWDTLDGAVAYDVELDGGLGHRKILREASSRACIPAGELPSPPGLCTIRVRSVASLTGDAFAGPWSAPAAIATVPVTGVRGSYDGRRARLSWAPSQAAGVYAYLVTVSDDVEIAVQAFAATTEVTVDVPGLGDGMGAVVQPLTSSGAGSPSERLPLFGRSLFFSSDRAQAPHLFPATAPALKPEDVVVFLPQLFTTPPDPPALPREEPFVMAPAEAPYAYTLTMPAGSAVWDFGAEPVRAKVAEAYAGLLEALVKLGVTPIGWRTLQDAIARAMPQTFAETLRYAYGLQPDFGAVDLRPGMVLRATFETYQYLGPDARNSDLLDGYATTATAEYDVSSSVTPDGRWLTGFDAFLSRIVGAGTRVPAPVVTDAGASGGGGIVDLYYTQFREPYVRLVYPPDLLGADAEGDPRPEFNVALLAAADPVTLDAATRNLREGRPLGSGVAVTYLRGRTHLTACARVWVDGAPTVVPVGSTAANALETMARRPPIADGLALEGIELVRAAGAAVVDDAAVVDEAAGVPVRLDWGEGTAYDPVTDRLSLPLLPGDRLSTARR